MTAKPYPLNCPTCGLAMVNTARGGGNSNRDPFPGRILRYAYWWCETCLTEWRQSKRKTQPTRPQSIDS